MSNQFLNLKKVYYSAREFERHFPNGLQILDYADNQGSSIKWVFDQAILELGSSSVYTVNFTGFKSLSNTPCFNMKIEAIVNSMTDVEYSVIQENYSSSI
jgi:hypothetical protein